MVNTSFAVADYLLTRLLQLNVTEVFHVPGDNVKHFTQTLEHFTGVNAIGCVNDVDAGDGGFMTVCQSLSTLARNNLNAVIFVIRDGVYGVEQVYVNIQAFNTESGQDFDTFDILPKRDYMALATAFGAIGHRVTTIDELEAVLEIIKVTEGRPTLVEVVIPEKELSGQMYRLGME